MNEERIRLEKQLADLKDHEAVADSPTRFELNRQIGEVQRQIKNLPDDCNFDQCGYSDLPTYQTRHPLL